MHPHTRRVHISQELSEHLIDARYDDAIRHLIAQIEAGHDVNTHLSQSIECGYVTKSSGKKAGRDIDGLLNDWSIHHLHRSQIIEGNGFVKHGRHVLAAIVAQDDVYLLDIIDYQSWNEQRLVEIAIENWPDAELYITLNLLAGDSIASNDRHMLREVGICSPVLFKGRYYISSKGFISTVLIPSQATHQAQRLFRELIRLGSNPNLLLSSFRAVAGFNNANWPTEPRYRVLNAVMHDRYCFVIQEEVTGLVLGLSV